MKWIKKINFRTWILFIGGLYFAGVVLQNIMAVKMVGTDTVSITDCGLIVSWFVFMCMDIITELLGKKKAITYFTIASVLNIIATIIIFACNHLPGADPFVNDAFNTVFQTNWRIAISSVAAFWVGNYVNAFIMYILRARAKDKDGSAGYILRAIISSVLGQFVDNALFYLLAFAPYGIPGTYELPWIAIIQNVSITTGFEVVVESLFVPLSAFLVKKLKKLHNKEQQECPDLKLSE